MDFTCRRVNTFKCMGKGAQDEDGYQKGEKV